MIPRRSSSATLALSSIVPQLNITPDTLYPISAQADPWLFEVSLLILAARLRSTQIIRALKVGVIALRDDLHGLRGDLRRQERAIASLEVDIDRISSRLGLSES